MIVDGHIARGERLIHDLGPNSGTLLSLIQFCWCSTMWTSSACAPQCEQAYIRTGIFTVLRPRMDCPISRLLIHLSRRRANGLLWDRDSTFTIRQICGGISWTFWEPLYFLTTGSQDQDRTKHNNGSEKGRHKEIGSTLQILSLITQLRPPSPKRCGYEKWSQVTFPCNQQRRLAKLRRKTILSLFATNVFVSKTLPLHDRIDDGISSALFNRTCRYDTKEIGARRAGGGLGWGGISFRPI